MHYTQTTMKANNEYAKFGYKNKPQVCLSYPLIMERATSDTQIAHHLTGVSFGCTINMWHNNRNSVDWEMSADSEEIW